MTQDQDMIWVVVGYHFRHMRTHHYVTNGVSGRLSAHIMSSYVHFLHEIMHY